MISFNSAGQSLTPALQLLPAVFCSGKDDLKRKGKKVKSLCDCERLTCVTSSDWLLSSRHGGGLRRTGERAVR